MTSTLLITGATGFIGSRVARRATTLPTVRTTVLHHRRPVTRLPPATPVITGDLAEPASLRGVCDGVDVLLHCASRIGGPAEDCEAVNARGTAALMAEARRAGVRRVVYLSTASVHGRGPFRGARPDELARAPVSATSRTRAAAEDAVLDAGGIVLRPHIVYGEGDRWVGPALTALTRALPGTVDRWTARLSAIDVEDLADALLGTALAAEDALTSSVYHANHPEPVTCHDLLRALAAAAGTPWPARDIGYPEARESLTAQGRTTHDLDMVAVDHWFDSRALWADLGRDPGPGFHGRFPGHAHWYRRALAARATIPREPLAPGPAPQAPDQVSSTVPSARRA
ncbi:NAD-dependent epimerase/dehydratase family protein [Allostreptomyces psammosilenae]|uniref:Nucleoside-diphosphate-sugar epimerase n=1 Tax=Allostreptomyces psammosilenae TaxID=1892865 RepID=A0A852ZQP8_9ACTN|nr:NAD-dependent epimerase/dehydratase family protein [Allostreptomyces psammosilenae]NYI04075.1 nucleoside-diphosphate-sugar epimerase [Allostreptomyces psammosilenae]